MTSLEQSLSSAGYRLTAARQAILQVIDQQSQPQTATDILVEAQKEHRHIGLVTIYRTLNVLIKEQLLRVVHSSEGCHYYQLASPGHHHVVLCSRCGNSIEFSGDEDINPLIQRVEKQTGFQITDHLLQLYGICSQCADSSNPQIRSKNNEIV